MSDVTKEREHEKYKVLARVLMERILDNHDVQEMVSELVEIDNSALYEQPEDDSSDLYELYYATRQMVLVKALSSVINNLWRPWA